MSVLTDTDRVRINSEYRDYCKEKNKTSRTRVMTPPSAPPSKQAKFGPAGAPPDLDGDLGGGAVDPVIEPNPRDNPPPSKKRGHGVTPADMVPPPDMACAPDP